MADQSFSKIWILIILIIFVAGGIFAWQYFGTSEGVKVPEKEEIIYSEENPPRFEDFPIPKKFEGTPAQVDFSTNPDALRFVTRITEGAQKGPNFAGHYTVISWGCGTECQSGVIVDANTGAIFSFFVTELDSDFRIDSNLFVVNPPNVIKEVYGNFEIPDWVYTAYYKWENNQFVNIYDTRTANWKTYKNEEYGFEIKYPSNLFLVDSPWLTATGIEFIEDQWRGQKVHYSFIGIEFIETPLTLQEWTEENEIENTETLAIGSLSVLQFYSAGVSGGGTHTLIQHNKADILIDIENHIGPAGEGKKIPDDIYNQILSTFRYLE